VFLRYSGTENLARVMVEGPERGLIQAGAERIAERIRAAIGA
jgi:phosphomannomutase